MGGVGEAAVSDGVGVFLLTAPSRAMSSLSGRAEAEALTRHENASTREVRTNIGQVEVIVGLAKHFWPTTRMELRH